MHKNNYEKLLSFIYLMPKGHDSNELEICVALSNLRAFNGTLQMVFIIQLFVYSCSTSLHSKLLLHIFAYMSEMNHLHATIASTALILNVLQCIFAYISVPELNHLLATIACTKVIVRVISTDIFTSILQQSEMNPLLATMQIQN